MKLAELARWCRENVPDGRVSMCRVEPTCHPCPKLCGDCALVEKRALRELAAEEAAAKKEGARSPEPLPTSIDRAEPSVDREP